MSRLCCLVCRGSLSQEAVAVLPPCSPSLAQLPWLGLLFALAACGSIQGTVGEVASVMFCFVSSLWFRVYLL